MFGPDQVKLVQKMRKSDQPGLEDMFCGDVCTATVQRGMIEAWEVGRTRLELRGSWRGSDG